jgi:DNA-binding beta-propeller fold protein YncE
MDEAHARRAEGMLRSRVIILATVAALAAVLLVPVSQATANQRGGGIRHVVFVGNNWDGTADVLYPHDHYRRVARINIVPDLQKRLLDIYTHPDKLAYFLAIRELVGEGHDQYVDDMYSTPDGRLLIVSRPSLADVVGINFNTGKIAWRFPMDGYRSDHMGLSPDGKQVAVSDSTANVVHVLDTRTGKELGEFPSGDSPHENTYSRDGKLIYHASIGRVYTPTDDPAMDTSKGERWFEIVNAKTFKVLKRIDMGKKLEQAGYPDMSSAVRPMALAPHEHWVYFQVSFFHGFVEYNLDTNRVRRVVPLPIRTDEPKENYLLDSAHHGIAMNGRGTRLCVAGTMDNYAAIVNRKSMKYKIVKHGVKPYWSTTSRNGRKCYVSWSGTDSISVISYRKREEVAHIKVGDHPQRIRSGNVTASWLAAHS